MCIPDPAEFPTENTALLAWYCITCFATPAADDGSDSAISELVAIAGIVTCETIAIPELVPDGPPGNIHSELPEVPCDAIGGGIGIPFPLSPFPSLSAKMAAGSWFP